MNGNGRLAIPSQMNVSTTYADGPLAQPSSVSLQGPGGLQVLVCGGLTKVEALAGQILPMLLNPNVWHPPMFADVHGEEGAYKKAVTSEAVNLAELILAETARRRTEAAKETP